MSKCVHSARFDTELFTDWLEKVFRTALWFVSGEGCVLKDFFDQRDVYQDAGGSVRPLLSRSTRPIPVLRFGGNFLPVPYASLDRNQTAF